MISNLGLFDYDNDDHHLALDWIGREGSDEVDSFLKVARAKNWTNFSLAFENYKVSAMNMLYADSKGNIGMIGAYGQPILKEKGKTLDLIKEYDNEIVAIKKPTENPTSYNPESGFIASANNKPFQHVEVPLAFNYADDSRFLRLDALARDKNSMNVDDLKSVQLDIYSHRSHNLQKIILSKLEAAPVSDKDGLYEELQRWNGHYEQKSKGAVVFYGLSYYLWNDYIDNLEDESMREFYRKSERWKQDLSQHLTKMTAEEMSKKVEAYLPKVASFQEKYPYWGKFTQQSLKTHLGLVPVVGSKFSYDSYEIGGSSDTLNKYGRPLSLERVEAMYGATARHISDMSSLDENYFVLNGGQDSWLMNENLNDQTSLWKKGQYIKIPLSMEKVRREFDQALIILKAQDQ